MEERKKEGLLLFLSLLYSVNYFNVYSEFQNYLQNKEMIGFFSDLI